MATSIASQLQAIKAFVKADSEPDKRPFTRPSIIFSPKEAADIDIDTVLDISLSGLEVLVGLDQHFRNYKNVLFSHASKELDRELMGIEENNRIDASISSYLRLLSGHLQLPSALKTLEYLVRRYKIHVYNTEELILCALPYHDTHAFVRIAQLLDTGNSKWKFLEGVKVSGAPPPRKVIVQQCVRDRGVLEVLCNFASPAKKWHPPRPVINFCTAVVIEALGSITTIDNDIVKRVLPFAVSGLQLGAEGGLDHKAGALMIIVLLANRVALSPKLVNSLIRSIAETARDAAKEPADLQWFRMSFMALINLVQLQSVETFPKKALEILKEIRDLPGVLTGIVEEFNIGKFLTIFLESLIDHSFSDDLCHHALISIIDTVPVKGFIYHIVSKLLSSCMKLMQRLSEPTSSGSGSWAKQILVIINENYPTELRAAVHRFMKDSKLQSKKGDLMFEILGKMFDGNLDMPLEISDSKIWFALEHPKAEVRRVTLSNLDVHGLLKDRIVDSQRLVTVQDAILRRLRDDDLTVVQAALQVDGLSKILISSHLLEAFQNVLQRCLHILISDVSHGTSLAGDVAVSCLKLAFSNLKDQNNHKKELASLIFPLLLIQPRSQRLNLTALELSKEVDWPFYRNLVSPSSLDKKLEHECISSINMDTVNTLAKSFSSHPEDYMPWIIECCHAFELSKTLFFLLLLQSFIMEKNDFDKVFTILKACLPVLKSIWKAFETAGDVSVKEFNLKMLNGDTRSFLDQLFHTNIKEFTVNLLASVFWKLLETYSSAEPTDGSLDYDGNWSNTLQDLFVFFAASETKLVFRNHLYYLVTRCKISAVPFLAKFFSEEGVSVALQLESLHCFVYLCSQSEDSLPFQLLSEFPSVLVPLCSDNQDIRVASMYCMEGLFALWPRFNISGKKNGNSVTWSLFLEELLGLIVQQKMLILSDRNFLPSFLTSLLGSSCSTLVVPLNVAQRFDQSTKEDILGFILGSAFKLSAFAKKIILTLLKGMGSAIMYVKDVESLLSELLKRRCQYYVGLNKSGEQLSAIEVEILCLLLESCAVPSLSFGGDVFEDYILEALQLDSMSPEDPAIIHPCVTVLRKLSCPLYNGLKVEMQALIFQELVFLLRNTNADIRNATQEALLRINITDLSVGHILDLVCERESLIGLTNIKKRKKEFMHQNPNRHCDVICKGGNALTFLSSLLDILLQKKDIENRAPLIKPLFNLLAKIFMEEWVHGAVEQEKFELVSSDISQSLPGSLCYIQQTLLLILQDIVASLTNDVPRKDDIVSECNVQLLVECARLTEDAVTRNHVFSLLSTIARVNTDKVLDHMVNIIAVIGESAVAQCDRHSRFVFEDLVSALVPCWLSKRDSIDELLQIFINVLPEIAEHRRLSIIVYLIRKLGEHSSLSSFLSLLFRSLVSRIRSSWPFDNIRDSGCVTCTAIGEWEHVFAGEVCEQFSCMMWLPSLVSLVQQVGVGVEKQSQEHYIELLFVMEFILYKLQDPDFSFQLESRKDAESLQKILGALMEQVVSHLQLVDSKRKQMGVPNIIRKRLNECTHTVLRTITNAMLPSAYFKAITKLLVHADRNVRKKALGLLGEAVKDHGMVKLKKGRGELNSSSSYWRHLDEESLESFEKMCLDIVHIVDDCVDDSNASLKLSAVSTLEVLACMFPNNYSAFCSSLASVTKNINSHNLAVSSGCLRTTGALINVLGPRALSELPFIMKNMLKRSSELSSNLVAESSDENTSLGLSSSKESLVLSILVPLEAVVDKLGGFLNPYLGDIVELLVLHPQYASASNPKIKLKADIVRKLFTEKIPVRLSLPPLLNIYSSAVKSGDLSLTLVFEILANIIGTMDKQSIRAYHPKIYDMCLQALDLRRQHTVWIEDISCVEKGVINAMIVLTMKLTEAMFKPLFIKSIEWAESNVEEGKCANPDRAISFYGLVNKLAENHRSLFVPYFKYFLEDCIRHLTVAEDSITVGLSRKKKKSKLLEVRDAVSEGRSALTLGKWHLRALILSSLHKCFLYDTGSLKFLDSNNFQVLLKPIVSQLVAEPPISLEDYKDIPSVNDVDDILVSCIGQMAVTAGSDLLWKPLNHEVCMQTRSEKVRSRVLGLRIVKYLVENLKEEYLVILDETIPFLGELLEDVELSVKSLAQEIFREMESLSGENLRQFL